MSASEPSRLSRSVIPSHYDLVIRTDLKAPSFSGVGEILLDILEPVSSLTIHVASPLQLKAAVVARIDADDSCERVRKADTIAVDDKLQRATLSFEGESIAPGSYKLGCVWKGVLEPSMVGYFSGSHIPEGETEKSYFAMTQFQPCDARRAYPCFDEPDLKATFSISLISRSGTTSLSNMNVESTEALGAQGLFQPTQLLTESLLSSLDLFEDEENDAWELVKFAKSPKMSTYLAAWGNGNFDYIEGGYHSAVEDRFIPIRFYALPHEVHQATLALKASEQVLPIYEKIFDIAFPLPKLDTLVTPAFGNGAMENFGLVIGGSSVYMVDEEKASLAARKLTIKVASHELAHQWFGNITTMEWWDNLWLNEAFATIVGEVLVVDQIAPEWKCDSSFIFDHLSKALQLDAARSSHPIEMPCPDEATINQIFDAVSYSKGASVLKMLSNYVGQEVFLKGVSTYLKRHLYGNARTADLFKGISDECGQDVSKMMDSWVSKIGFPVLTVEETDKGIKIRQKRFLSTADATPEEDETIWQIPLEPLIVESGRKDVKHGVLLTDREDTFEIADVKNATYKLNAETCGVYRVLYPAERLVKIGEEAGKENSAFSLNDRMGLVNDATVLASSGYARTSSALSLLSKLGNEKEYLVWQEIAASLKALSQTWVEQPQKTRDAIDKFRRALFRPLFERLGFDASADDNVDTTQLRTLAISTLAEAGDTAVLEEYQKRFNHFVQADDESQIPGDLRGSIYSESVKHGGEQEYAKVLAVYRNPPSPEHKKAARTALASPQDPTLLGRTISMLLTEVPSHEIAAFGIALKTNPVGSALHWTWFKSNYDTIIAKFQAFYLSSQIGTAVSGFSTRSDYDKVVEFFADKDRTAYAQAYEQKLDAILARVRWLERDCQDVDEWLRAHKYL
ncbi:M1 family metallopeptidase [Sporobolomyces koalae]|uniref:M1 family metallopeptidase n=1 Tax=Sporobolomyces koalae TaxID=500713 RepID=UPI00316FBA84